ncbi:MAG: DNA-directed RNA polymerase subunit K [Candidatus Micrarchaeota archaeon]|mgnify:CR=1 FL=1
MAKQRLDELSKYERARIVGARALQLAMGAPPLVKIPSKLISAVRVAFMEFEKDAIPLRVLRVPQ